MTSNLQEKIFKSAQYGIKGAGIIADKFSPSISQKFLTRRPGNVQVLPETASNITAKLVDGAPVTPIDLNPGRSLAASFTLVIDMSAVSGGTGSGQTTVVLFDKNDYHKKRNGIASAIPAGTVFVEDATNNIYDSIVSDLCGETLHLYGITVRASAASTATITPEQQVNQNIVMFSHNADGSEQDLLRMNQYYDPQQFDRTKQIVPLQGRAARLDKRKAWVYKVYNGLTVEIDFFLVASTRD